MSNLPIHEKIKLFADAAESLLDEISPEEMAELSKDIEKSAENIWRYIQLLESDSTRLSNIAMLHAETAAKQKKKAVRMKDYLKFALKSNNFSKLKAGSIQMSLVESKKAVAKRPASEIDFYAYPDLIDPKFRWKEDPSIADWIDNQGKIDPVFTWNLKALKTAGRDELIDYETTLRLTVKVAKED